MVIRYFGGIKLGAGGLVRAYSKCVKETLDHNEIIMLEKVQNMLAEALNIPVAKITPDSKIVDDLGADSLDVVELLSRLEDEFGVVIPDEDIEGLKTVQDVADELEKIGVVGPFEGSKPRKVLITREEIMEMRMTYEGTSEE